MLYITVPILDQPDVDLKVFKTVLSLIGTWTVAWTPYAVVALIGISGHGHLLTVLIYTHLFVYNWIN